MALEEVANFRHPEGIADYVEQARRHYTDLAKEELGIIFPELPLKSFADLSTVNIEYRLKHNINEPVGYDSSAPALVLVPSEMKTGRFNKVDWPYLSDLDKQDYKHTKFYFEFATVANLARSLLPTNHDSIFASIRNFEEKSEFFFVKHNIEFAFGVYLQTLLFRKEYMKEPDLMDFLETNYIQRLWDRQRLLNFKYEKYDDIFETKGVDGLIEYTVDRRNHLVGEYISKR